MAFDFSAPSFSLGLDLDSDEDKEKETLNPNLDNSTGIKDDEHDDFEEIQPRPSLKRLRRGTSPPPPHPTSPPQPPELASHLDQDDDIESFSSEEDDVHSSPQFNACSNLKVPLHSRGILSSQSTSKSKIKILPTCNASTLGNSIATGNKDPFPSLTISPLRKLDLFESHPSFPVGFGDEENGNKEQPLSGTVDNVIEQRQDRPVFKRLRQGVAQSAPSVPKLDTKNISSQEFADNHYSDVHSSPHFNASCNLKVPLHSGGILSSQSTSKSKIKILPTCNTSTLGNSMATGNKDPFPSLTISPLRKLDLFESYPSFSLGFGDEENGNKEQPLSETVDNVIEQPQDRPVLKRLRRGAAQSTPSVPKHENMNADIENISIQEFVDNHHPEISASLQNKQPSSTLKTPAISQAHNTSIPSSFEASTSKNLFKKPSISPVRRINLIISDSDSDDPSSSKIKSDAKKKKSVQFQSDTFRKELKSKEKNITKISTPAITKISTPALDDFCDEYFKSSKSNTPSVCSSKVIDPEDSIEDFETIFEQKSGSEKSDHNWNFPNSKPPAYQYFFHEDARVRNLVRERLPHFVPNGVDSRGENLQQYEEDINYMGQFGSATGQSRGNKNNKIGSSSNTKVVKQRKPKSTSKAKASTQNTEEWVNPRNSASVPRDAGKRRVSAEGSQAGHWFTGRDGRKVYVSKNGEELTGQFAYRQYRRESGIASKKGKKKATTGKSKKN